MALTTLSRRWAPRTFWTPPDEVQGAWSLSRRWAPRTFWAITYAIEEPDPGDTTAPAVLNFSPAPGASLSRGDTVGFDVIDDSGTFARILIAVAYPASGVQELAHDGDAFAAHYAASTRVPISGGYRYRLTRAGGWPHSPTVRIFPVDASGNEP